MNFKGGVDFIFRGELADRGWVFEGTDLAAGDFLGIGATPVLLGGQGGFEFGDLLL